MLRLRSFVVEHRTDLLWAAAIFAVAFTIRFVFVLWVDWQPLTGTIDDSNFYHLSARAMADGKGYINPWRHLPTAQWPPGYTAFLASVYILPGPDAFAGKMLNVVLGALTCSLVFATGRLMWNRAVGVAAGLLVTFFPSHVFSSTILLSEVVYIALLSGLILWFAWALKRKTAVGWRLPVLLGLLIGAATMVRGEGMFLPLVFGAAWGFAFRSPKRGLWFGGLAIAGMMVIISGWTVRNAIQIGAPIPVSTGSARMAQAHWDGADGGVDSDRVQELNSLYPEVPYPEREVKVSQYSMRQGLRFMVTHPLTELSLIPRREYFLYRHDHAAVDLIDHKENSLNQKTLDRLRTVSDAYYFVAMGWALLGIWLWRSRPDFAVLLFGIVFYLSALVGILYAGVERYHTQLIPVIALAAAAPLVLLRDVGREPQPAARVQPSGDLPTRPRSVT